MRTIFRIIAVAAASLTAFFSASQAYALVSPLGAAILAPVQFPPTSFTIVGARLSVFWGEHRDVYGLDAGAIGNMTDGSFAGIGVSGLFNYNKGTATIVGLQLAGAANVNINKTRVVGLQVAGLTNMNKAESTVAGLQFALANICPAQTTIGFQAGIYNKSHTVYGFQIGLVNVTESLHGLQIGLVNFNKTGLFAVAPILNVGF
jgi:hypothetical protein